MKSQLDEWLETGYLNGWITKTTCITHAELTRPANDECVYLIQLNMTEQPMPSQQYECSTCEQRVIVHREISNEQRPICIRCSETMQLNDGLTHVDTAE
jgi:formylmethanofuran dehydrogenase subunit E